MELLKVVTTALRGTKDKQVSVDVFDGDVRRIPLFNIEKVRISCKGLTRTFYKTDQLTGEYKSVKEIKEYVKDNFERLMK